jgi:serine/threonine protein kinase
MSSSESVFRKAALLSQLLTGQDLEEAIEAVRAEVSDVATSVAEISDDMLADRLIEMQRINRWQAEQLKLGNTRFHLKDYQIIDSIGQGGMGQVFKAEHSLMGRVVAIKVLPKSRSTEEAVASFQQEIRTLANLDHPNLVRAYDAGHDGNVHFLVTEFVPGTDLRYLVRRGGGLKECDAATLVTDTARGLAHAHECRLVHRDVKPGNIMVTPEGKVKVLDLGLAGFLQEELEIHDPKRSEGERSGRIVGTADYLAPEVIEGNPATPASDIYALGCTLYYAITRKVPFPGGSSVQKCHRHLNEIPINPRRFHLDMSDEFLTVLSEMMEKNPKQRIQKATDVIDRMAPWAETTLSSAIHSSQRSGASGTFARASAPPPLEQSLSADVRKFPEMQAAESGSQSQISQGTDRVSHASQTTTPAIKKRDVKIRNRSSRPLAIFYRAISRMSDAQFFFIVGCLSLLIVVLFVLLLY